MISIYGGYVEEKLQYFLIHHLAETIHVESPSTARRARIAHVNIHQAKEFDQKKKTQKRNTKTNERRDSHFIDVFACYLVV